MNQSSGIKTHNAIDRLLRPQSIAIVGASPTPGAFGASVLANLERASFAGELFLVNPKRNNIGGRPCVATVDDLPAGIDCAVLAIPQSSVLETVQACARRRIGAVIIFSAGFAEAGDEGRAEQEKIREIARSSGMTIEGPNCLGLVNYVDKIALTFVATEIERCTGTNGIAIVSQSGAMAAVLGVSLRHKNLDLSFSVSTGNEAASGVEDFVEYMIGEVHTRVIAMIVEQFRQPRRFVELVRQARRAGKTIVLLHPGSSSAARNSAATHTGAMAGDYLVMRTKVEHAGVIMVDTLEEFVDVADILVRCPSLPHAGAAVFTESGAFKALTLDFCESLGLELPALSPEAAAGLRTALPEFIPPTNPLDLTAQGLIDPDLYRRTLPIVLSDKNYGSVILAIILTDEATSGLKLPPILEAIRDIRPTKPVLFVGMDEGAKIDDRFVEELRSRGIPFFPTPERAFRALARVTCFASKQAGVEVVQPTVAANRLDETGVIPEYKSKQILASWGIPIPPGELAITREDALSIAHRIGFPVVLKAQSTALTHKSDVGGVALNLHDDTSLSVAWDEMRTELRRRLPDLVLDGILVEKMGSRGVELIVGAQNDKDWGPVLLVGLGGVLAEALNDLRLLPPELSVEAIEAEIRRLKGAALLNGFRGSPPLDVTAAARIVAQLGSMMLSHPSIREVDINPVVVYPVGQGAIALDALVVVVES